MTAPRVLVVDDSLTVRMDLEEVFRSDGFEVVACDCLASARAALAAREFDLAVLDVILPDGDGLELLAELREGAQTAELPVLLLSTEAEVRDRLRALEQGADEYVGKPYDGALVVTRARQLLASRGRTPDSPLVLVVDQDDAFTRELLAQLEATGYRVARATSGPEGLASLVRLAPSAVVVGARLPGTSGSEVIRRIRVDPGLRATPCVMLTESHEASAGVEALEVGADAYSPRDQGVELLLTRLRALLRAAPETSRRGPDPGLLGPERVLVVDDSLTYRHRLGDLLLDGGYDAVLADSGEEALRLLPAQRVDAVLLDVVMPGLSGFEVCRRIKGVPGHRTLPVLLLTAHDARDVMLKGIDAGADDYIPKTVESNVLLARLRAQLRRRRFEREHQRIHAELVAKEAEARLAREVADAKAGLLAELQEKNALLERRSHELELLNGELKSFAYSVSHDLRQPLRGMSGFSEVLLARYADALDDRGRHYLERIQSGARRLETMIDGLLTLSRVTRAELRRAPVRLDDVARRVLADLSTDPAERRIDVEVDEGLSCVADESLLENLLENLLGNAWKFTSETEHARIHVGRETTERGECAFYVQDNGAGFDMRYAENLFGAFQRLHSDREFAGTGIGLATVQRIVHRHGGRVWAEAAVGEGARFSFTLAPPTRSGGPHE